MGRLRALLWDVDGTLAETERDGHRVAFNQAFEAHGLPWRWDEARYGELLAVTGGRERLLHDMAAHPDAPDDENERQALAAALHRTKNEAYARLVAAGRIALRPGVRALVAEARRAGLAQAIVTTTSRANAQALRAAHFEPGDFDLMVCGEDVMRKKPHPEAYLVALDRLRLAAPDVLAIEDSPPGAAAALAAGVPVVVARSRYFADAAFPGALAVVPSLEGFGLARLAVQRPAHEGGHASA